MNKKEVKDIGLVITDTHLSEGTEKVNISIFRQAIATCLERGIKKIYHMGDAMESRKAQSLQVLKTFGKILMEIREAGLEIDFIPGNHDKTDYQSENSFLDPFSYHPGVNIWSKGTVNRVGDNLSLFQVPFFDEKSGMYGEMIKPYLDIAAQEKKQGMTNILLTHIGVNEAVMNGGSVIEGHLDGSLFDAFDNVYVGHYHDYQELKKGKIVYVGSAYQSNFGEDDRKGYHILNSKGGMEFIQAHFPKYIKISIDMEKEKDFDLTEIKKEYEGSTDNIRIEFTGTKEMLAKVDKREFEALGMDVKKKEESVDVLDYDDSESTFTKESIKDEWEVFSKDSIEIKSKGLEYIEPLFI